MLAQILRRRKRYAGALEIAGIQDRTGGKEIGQNVAA